MPGTIRRSSFGARAASVRARMRRPDRRAVRRRRVRRGDRDARAGRLAHRLQRRRLGSDVADGRGVRRGAHRASVESNLALDAAGGCSRRCSPTCASSPAARRRATTSPRWCCATEVSGLPRSDALALDPASARLARAGRSSALRSGTRCSKMMVVRGRQGLPARRGTVSARGARAAPRDRRRDGSGDSPRRVGGDDLDRLSCGLPRG